MIRAEGEEGEEGIIVSSEELTDDHSTVPLRRGACSEEEEEEEDSSLECRQQLLSALATLAQQLDFRTSEGIANKQSLPPSSSSEERSSLDETSVNVGVSICEAELCLMHDCSADYSTAAFLLNCGTLEILLLLLDRVLVPGLEALEFVAAEADSSSPQALAALSDKNAQLLLSLSRDASCSTSRIVELLIGTAANLSAFCDSSPSSEVQSANAILTRTLPEAVRIFVEAALRCTDTAVLRESFRGLCAAAAFRTPNSAEFAEEFFARFNLHGEDEEDRVLLLQAQTQRLVLKPAFESLTLEGAAESEFLGRLLFVLQSALYAPLLQHASQALALLLETESLDRQALEVLSAKVGNEKNFVDEWTNSRPLVLCAAGELPFLKRALRVAAERSAELLGVFVFDEKGKKEVEGKEGTENAGSAERSVEEEETGSIVSKAVAFVRSLEAREEVGDASLDAEKEVALEAMLLLCSDLFKRLMEENKEEFLRNEDCLHSLLLRSCLAACCFCDSDGLLKAALRLLSLEVSRASRSDLAQKSVEEALQLRTALFAAQAFREEVVVRVALLAQLADKKTTDSSASPSIQEVAVGALWMLAGANAEQLDCYAEELQRFRRAAQLAP